MSLAKPKRGEPDEALGAGGGGGRAGGGGGEGEIKRLRKLSVKRWTARDCRRQRRQSGKNVASFALVIAGLLSGTREVLGAEYVDRGEVSMDCDDCSCIGSSDDGTITVFDNPSSGERVADVDGSLSEIRQTACGMSIIAVDDNLYDLSGLDLRVRELEVVDMSSDDCTTKDTPDEADCYAGSTSKSLSGGVEMDLNICLCSFIKDDVVVRKANVKSNVSGTNSVEIDNGLKICLGNGFISYLVAATVNAPQEETYYYNFDLAISGEDSSEDLDVSSAAPSSAEEFLCDETEPTLSPGGGDDDVEQAEPTSSPIGGGVSGTAAPQPGLPTTATTIAPIVLGTEATMAPAPSPATATLAPAGVGVATAAPVPAVVPTEVPVATARPVAAPGGAGGGGGRGDKPTVAPSSTDTNPAERTRPPYSEDELAEADCTLPKEIPCTLGASAALTKFGMGIYFDLECAAGSASAGNLSGCGTEGVDVCRTCIFNTPLFNGKDDWEGGVPDFVDCPCCVLDDYPGSVAINEEGPRCQTPSPSPSGGSVGEAGGRPTDPREFHDRPRNLGGGEGWPWQR